MELSTLRHWFYEVLRVRAERYWSMPGLPGSRSSRHQTGR